MRHKSASVVLGLLALAAITHQAAAIEAPHGAYLGCFPGSALSLRYQAQSIDKSTLTKCAPSCAAANYGLAFITTDFKCFCSNTVPSTSGLTNADCQSGKTGIAAFYLHKDASSTLCRVSNPAMNTAWNIAYNTQNVNFNAADNSLSVKLDGTSGSRLESKDGKFLYGVYQIEAKVSPAAGVVSSFYTRSSDVYPNNLLSDFCEIDWEFLNAAPVEPQSIWLNSFTKTKSNGERKVAPSEYQSLLGSTGRTGDSWTTYTLNWQPDYVAWVLNGTLLQMSRTSKGYQSPNLPSMQVISVWTDTRPVGGGNFGGVVDQSKGPYYSYFRNLKRVVCDASMPTNADAAALAMGPAWLYGKTDNTTVVTIPSPAPAATTASPSPKPTSVSSPSPKPAAVPSPSPAPVTPTTPTSSAKIIPRWSQCGGTGGNCTMPGYICDDAAYLGYTCESGYGCQRTNVWYWQCVEGAALVITTPTTPSPSPAPAVSKSPSPAPTVIPSPAPKSPSPAPVIPPPSPAPSSTVIAAWGQCGGNGGDCKPGMCGDAQYPGCKCAAGYSCKRQSEWYWQCAP